MTTSPFNPRDVEVLSAALPPQGANQIGRDVRAILVQHFKGMTPGHLASRSFRTIFFPNVGHDSYGAMIAAAMGLDDAFCSDLATKMLCRRMSLVTTKLRPEMLVARIEEALTSANARIRRQAYLAYAFMAVFADTPVRPALAAFGDQPSRTLAKQHYLAGLTSPAWINDKLVQDASGNWTDRDWELYQHFIKLTALGATVTEIDAAITQMMRMQLPVPPELGPGAWHLKAIWLNDNFGSDDVAEATAAMLEKVRPWSWRNAAMPEKYSFEFTAKGQPGNPYRQAPSGSCFAPGTRVVMADASLRTIEEIVAGEAVRTPSGPRQVLLRTAPLRGERTLVQFSGTGFAFAPAHPFLVAPSGSTSAAYAAAAPDALARSVPTLSQFGITPLNGPAPAILVRHTGSGDVPFPAPKIHEAPGVPPDFLYDLFLDIGPDGRSEYYAGDDDVQLLVSSEVPRFAAAPETTAVVLHILRQAGPTVLQALADVPDRSFEDLLCVGLDSLASTMMPTIGPQLRVGPESVPHASSRGTDSAAEMAASVREFATAMSAMADGPKRRMGIMVERFAAHFGPQFMAVLAMPWRTFDLAAEDVATMLSVTPYSIELFRPGPPVGEAQIEVALVRGRSRSTRRLRARPGAPADRWYYSVDTPAYFPEWAPPGPAAMWGRSSEAASRTEEDLLWELEIALQPDTACRMVLPLPRDIGLGYQEFRAPLEGAHGEIVGQTVFDVRLLTLEGFAAEVRTRDAAGERASPSLTPLADRLARLAADFVETQFAEAVAAFKDCTATIET